MGRILFILGLFLSSLSFAAYDVSIKNVQHPSSVVIGNQVTVSGWIINNGSNTVQVQGLNVFVDTVLTGSPSSVTMDFTILFSQQEAIQAGDSLFFEEDMDIDAQYFHANFTDIVIVWPIVNSQDVDETPEDNYYQGEMEVMAANSIAEFNIQNNTLIFSSNHKDFKLQLFDLSGQLVLESNQTNTSLSDLKTGIYIVKTTINNTSYSRKIYFKK